MDENIETPVEQTPPEGQTPPVDQTPEDQTPPVEQEKPADQTPDLSNLSPEMIAAITAQIQATKEAEQAKEAEAEKLKNMTKAERERYDFEKQQEQFKQQQADLEMKMKEFEKAQLIAVVKDQLIDKSLPAAFADFIVGDDAEKSKANIDVFATEFQKAVEAAVEKRLGAPHTPKAAIGNVSGVTKVDYTTMSQSQIMALMQTNPELFK